MAKVNKYAEAAFETLTELGGGPVRSKELADAVHKSGRVEESKYSYHYILKACKDDSRFDTSTRGRVAFATAVEKVEEISDTPAENLAEVVEEVPVSEPLGEPQEVKTWGTSEE